MVLGFNQLSKGAVVPSAVVGAGIAEASSVPPQEVAGVISLGRLGWDMIISHWSCAVAMLLQNYCPTLEPQWLYSYCCLVFQLLNHWQHNDNITDGVATIYGLVLLAVLITSIVTCYNNTPFSNSTSIFEPNYLYSNR
jgi:hypothetical protein